MRSVQAGHLVWRASREGGGGMMVPCEEAGLLFTSRLGETTYVPASSLRANAAEVLGLLDDAKGKRR